MLPLNHSTPNLSVRPLPLGVAPPGQGGLLPGDPRPGPVPSLRHELCPGPLWGPLWDVQGTNLKPHTVLILCQWSRFLANGACFGFFFPLFRRIKALTKPCSRDRCLLWEDRWVFWRRLLRSVLSFACFISLLSALPPHYSAPLSCRSHRWLVCFAAWSPSISA